MQQEGDGEGYKDGFIVEQKKRIISHRKFLLLELIKSRALQIKIFVTSVLTGTGFLQIFTVDFDRLLQVRLGQLRVNDCPAGLESWPRRVRAHRRKRRKATVKKRRNTAPGFKALDPFVVQQQPWPSKKLYWFQ